MSQIGNLLSAFSGVSTARQNPFIGNRPEQSAEHLAEQAQFEAPSKVTFDPDAPIPDGPIKRGMIIDFLV